MKKDDMKKAFTEAQKEVKEESIKKLKEFVKRTLEKRERLRKEREERSRQIKILDRDIQDLKEGRLDRIEERQKKDPEAKLVSIAIVEKDRKRIEEHHHHYHYDRWYYPYQFIWNYPDNVYLSSTAQSAEGVFGFSINNSIAKDNTAGTYALATNGDDTRITYVS